ncbi:hypothetical protein COSO111634_27020 [Corallococcus soli]
MRSSAKRLTWVPAMGFTWEKPVAGSLRRAFTAEQPLAGSTSVHSS